jgi:hypothetical protein
MTLTFAKVFKHSFDGCKGAIIEAPLGIATVYFPPYKCPYEKGMVKQLHYVQTEKTMPTGSTTSLLTSVDQNKQSAMCVELTLDNA